MHKRPLEPEEQKSIKIPKLSFTPEKFPSEDNFILDYFKGKGKKIINKYKTVQEEFINESDKIPTDYTDYKDKGNMKTKTSPGWEYIVNDNEPNIFNRKKYVYNVISQHVTHIGGKIFKAFVFNKSQNATLFMITLEITMQKMAYEILKANDYLKDKVIIPKITNHYQVDSYDKESYEIIIEMEYIEHKQLEQNNVDTAKNALEELRKHDIYHFDTHTDNIRQTEEGKIVILDFGKAQITKIPDIHSTTGLYEAYKQDADGKQIPVTFDYPKWASRTDPNLKWNENVNFYGGKKNKSKRKTKKGKKKKGKSKKRTYRKRK